MGNSMFGNSFKKPGNHLKRSNSYLIALIASMCFKLLYRICLEIAANTSGVSASKVFGFVFVLM